MALEAPSLKRSTSPHNLLRDRDEASVLEVEIEFDWQFQQAVMAYIQNREQKALELFEKCLAMRPGDPKTIHNIEKIRKKKELP